MWKKVNDPCVTKAPKDFQEMFSITNLIYENLALICCC